MQRFSFISDHIQSVLGFSADEWKNTPGFWEDHIHPADRHIASAYRDSFDSDESSVFEYRMIAANGHVVWVRDVVLTSHNSPQAALYGVMMDVSLTEHLKMLENLERKMLHLNADLSITLNDVLLAYLQGLEEMFPQMLCSMIHVRNGRLGESVAPSLPRQYRNSLVDLEIGPDVGSCGTAAALKKQVIVSDIATDPLWEKYRDNALAHGLRACWSNPVINAQGEVIATLAMYYREAKHPTQEELNVMEKATALVRIILENRAQTEEIREANLLMLQSQELAHFGNWRWNIVNDVVSWSPALYTIYGLDALSFKATFAGYLELLHPEDREPIYAIIKQVLETGTGAEFNERIIRPDGSLRYLRSWAKLKKDDKGNPVEMIGACLDNTEKVLYANAVAQQSRQLLDIAWLQSHAVRSPLVRIMALSDMLRTSPADDAERDKILDHLFESAVELDKQVRLISSKTESES